MIMCSREEGSVLEHTKCYSGLVSQEDHFLKDLFIIIYKYTVADFRRTRRER